MHIVCITLIPVVYPIIVIFTCLMTFKILKKIFPKGLSFVVGGKI